MEDGKEGKKILVAEILESLVLVGLYIARVRVLESMYIYVAISTGQTLAFYGTLHGTAKLV